MSISSQMEETEEMHQVEHHFAKEHVFERAECGWIVLRTQVLECLIKVRVGSGVVFVLSV
jgi:hypothetical protein